MTTVCTLTDPGPWSERLRQTLQAYDESLLRQVAGRLCKPRNQWPLEELIERSLATVQNPAVLDRRLAEVTPAARRLLALIGHSRQPRWAIGNLVELLVALGQADGLEPILELLQAGLLYPDLGTVGRIANPPHSEVGRIANPPYSVRLKSFEQWLAQSSAEQLAAFAHPLITARALGQDLELPPCPGAVTLPATTAVQEADGLQWPLRLAVLWQQVAANGPLRRTQQSDFFKRDLDRLRSDPLLLAAPPDELAAVPDVGLLTVALAQGQGLLREADGELILGQPPACWEQGLNATLASLWAGLLCLRSWNPKQGWQMPAPPANPYPSFYLLALLLLSRLPADGWTRAQDVEAWLLERHPYWRGGNPKEGQGQLDTFLRGIVYQMRLLQAVCVDKENWLVRLSPLGRWLLGQGTAPPEPVFPQTLLVQPNLEILVYRQGLSPALITRLSLFAAWKNLGAACTLQLQPETVYRALEAGERFETILGTLERHSMKATPDAVINALRTWADKRERIQVFAAGALFEFNSAEDLNDALARGIPAVRLSDRLAIVANESAIDYRHFRLIATRDYALPPEKCVEIDNDGITLSIDPARSDLLIETEVLRLAEPLERNEGGRRWYRLTPESLAAARDSGMSTQALEQWFVQRSGNPVPPAVRLLFNVGPETPMHMQQFLVLRTPTPELADGLQQWPGTRAFIEMRLGPTALVVAEENAAELERRLKALGVHLSR